MEIQAGGVSIVVSDPVFRLGVDDAGALTTVGVAQGAVSVNGELLVGGQEAVWAGGDSVTGGSSSSTRTLPPSGSRCPR